MTISNDPRVNELVEAFVRYAGNGDSATVQHYGRDEIEKALIQFRAHSHDPFYYAMERRLAALTSASDERERRAAIWRERLISFIVGIASAVLAGFLVWRFKWN